MAGTTLGAPFPSPLPSPLRSQQLILRVKSARGAIVWGSLLFGILQSICLLFATLDGLRLGLGLTWLVFAAGTEEAIDSFHVDWLRIPMIAIAIAGSLLNLVVLWQIRRLRTNPAARWRQRPVPPRTLRMERLQAALALVTLLLIFLEERQHLLWQQHL